MKPQLTPISAALCALCLLLLVGCCTTSVTIPNPPPVVIDIHTHLFNARYVPLREIAVSRGVPRPIAAILAKLLLAICGDSQLAEPGAQSISSDFVIAEAGQLARRNAKASASARAGVVREVFQPHDFKTILEPAEIDQLRAYFRGQLKLRTKRTSAAELSWDEIAEALEIIGILADQHGDKAQQMGLPIEGYLRFFGTMLTSERGIAEALHRTYPSVDLFVHHMMDLEHSYGQPPSFPFSRQIQKMFALDTANNGRSLTFAAFDPFRREQALPLAQHAYSLGAAGFKFYPPCGYRPAGNANFPPINLDGTVKEQWNSRYASITPDQLDAWIEAFFSFCESNNIPVFVHCTPHGFESVEGYGALMADPVHWRPVLTKHPNLRLCFGHTGGEGGWFDAQGGGNLGTNYSAEVVRLCVEFPNVYCEAAYLDPILTDSGMKRFQTNLVHVLRQHPGLAKKLMYGTDWHMLTQEDKHPHYLRQFNAVFDHPELAVMKADFFAGNAARYLRLRELATDQRLNAALRKNLAEILSRLDASKQAPRPNRIN